MKAKRAAQRERATDRAVLLLVLSGGAGLLFTLLARMPPPARWELSLRRHLLDMTGTGYWTSEVVWGAAAALSWAAAAWSLAVVIRRRPAQRP